MTPIKHFLQFKDFTREEYRLRVRAHAWIKDRFKRYEPYHPLTDRTLVMIFEKASTRTRLSFEAGMHQLGGSAIYLNTRDSQLGRGEPVEDAAQVISRMSDLVMIRTFEQEIIERFAANSRVPVINGLTNEYHPCQILADIFTFIEHRGSIQGKTVAWIGDSQQHVQHLAAGGRGARLQGACVKKVVLAYSGGLDTSVILKWLQDDLQCEVVTFTADIGQGEELEPARAKAKKIGIKPENIFIEDLREEFVRDFVFPMFRANALYEGEYLLGTSIARPLIAKRLIEIAKQDRADAISHGATGKGNDQVRFELGAYALMPNVKVIAPWREWDLLSREKLLAYADKHGIPVDFKKRKGGAPYSMDANLLHISYEGGILKTRTSSPKTTCGA
jgi:hypothetical protein